LAQFATSTLQTKVPAGLGPAVRRAGVDPREVLRRAKLPGDTLEAAGRFVSVHDYFALWSAIEELGPASVGLAIAENVQPELSEPLFLALLSARSIAEAANLLVRYKRLLGCQELQLERDARRREMATIYQWPAPFTDQPRVLVEGELGFWLLICRHGTGLKALNPRRVQLRARELPQPSRHADFFGCPVELGCAHNALVLSLEDFERPFVTHSETERSKLLARLDAQPSRLGSKADQVRAAVEKSLRGREPTLEAVSRDLAMSPRTVQRALQHEGTSFRDVLEESRDALATHYLKSTALTVGEIAFLLGYDDTSSFHRAFQARHATTPAAWRKKHSAYSAGRD
jgi:AraC-like DNA-binding protein